MNLIKQTSTLLICIAVFFLAMSSCSKDARKPPSISFKTGAGYTSGDSMATKNKTIKVGITADKVEDNMLTYNISYAYDGSATTTTLQTFPLSGSEQEHYEKDITFSTRNQAGTEKWIFTITDKDGNTAQKQLMLTVQ